MVLATLADVRELMRHLPVDRRERSTWRQVAADTEAAAAGGDIEGAATRSIQAYLGHRNIANTVRYTALSPGRFKGFFRD